MRAAVVHEPHRITIDDIPEPEPGPNEVVVAVKANGICGSDLHLLDGEWSFVQYPVIPGHEFSGEVVEVGPGVESNLVGRRVAVDPVVGCGTCDHCKSGRINLCRSLNAYGATRPGGSSGMCSSRPQSSPSNTSAECAGCRWRSRGTLARSGGAGIWSIVCGRV